MHIYYRYQIQFKSNFLSISMGSYFIIDVKHPTVEIQRLFDITPTGFLIGFFPHLHVFGLFTIYPGK